MASVSPIPVGYHAISPFLVLHDLGGFLDFLSKAFDVQVIRNLPGPDGAVGYAEVRLGDSHIFITDHMGRPEAPANIYFYVPKVDLVYEQALKAGATSVDPPRDQFYGDRTAGVKDNWGNTWWLATHIEDVNEGELARRNEEMIAQMAAKK
jgi:PhnB protein